MRDVDHEKGDWNPFASLDKVRGYERAAFGDHWCGPEVLGREYQLVARYEGEGEDCVNVEVDCASLPARFYRLRISGRGGDYPKQPLVLTTGSGMHEEVAMIAKAFAEGMLGHGDDE